MRARSSGRALSTATRFPRLGALAAAVWLFALPAASEGLDVSVRDAKGRPVKDAVVYAAAKGGVAPPPTGAAAVIDQVDKEFVPRVTAVRAGTAVSFPNRDRIRHHVYSFSKAKTFEIPLYKGMPPRPVLFDKPGVVALGCNIHDWMSAHVFVAETPFFAVTGPDGKAKIDGLDPGEYDVEVWYPRMKDAPRSTRRSISVKRDKGPETSFVIQQAPAWRAWRAPAASGGGYR
ncbi:MAG: hypothetical protein A2V83_04580 [Nitrospirae bacterium RBG_16_64_22]|nr:MAG: hypothetical protein A2V83_04580 [Nitrospirae bacterium RBG_16_64_22]